MAHEKNSRRPPRCARARTRAKCSQSRQAPRRRGAMLKMPDGNASLYALLGQSADTCFPAQRRSSHALRPDQSHADIVQLVVIAILDDEGPALAGAPLDLDLEAEHVRELLFERERVGGLLPTPARCCSHRAMNHRLDLAHIHVPLNDALRQGFCILSPNERPRVASGKLTFLDQALNRLRQLEQANRIRKMTPA